MLPPRSPLAILQPIDQRQLVDAGSSRDTARLNSARVIALGTLATWIRLGFTLERRRIGQPAEAADELLEDPVVGGRPAAVVRPSSW